MFKCLQVESKRNVLAVYQMTMWKQRDKSERGQPTENDHRSLQLHREIYSDVQLIGQPSVCNDLVSLSLLSKCGATESSFREEKKSPQNSLYKHV